MSSNTDAKISDRSRAAVEILQSYDFGKRVYTEEDAVERDYEGLVPADIAEKFEHESREWQYSKTGNNWTRPVYILTDGGGDQLYWLRLLFTVCFSQFSTNVIDVYVLNGKGSIYYADLAQFAGDARGDKSLVNGPWKWRLATDDKDQTVALVLETTARPIQSPVVIQALVDNLNFNYKPRAAALELIRLAPEMLHLLAEIVQASKECPEKIPEHMAQAEDLLEELSRNHYSVDFRVPGYWSSED